MKLLPALLLSPALALGALTPAAAQYGSSLYSVMVPGARPFADLGGYGSASDCTFISAPGAFERGGRNAGAAPSPTATIGLSAADYGLPGYSLFEFDPADPGDPARPAPERELRGVLPGEPSGLHRDSRCGFGGRFEAAARARIAARDRTWSLAMDAMARGDNARAVELFEKGYRRVGVPVYAYTAGLMLYNGQGVARDVGKAVDLFDQVALAPATRRMRVRFDPARPDQANASIDAMLALADIHLAGKDVPPDPGYAKKLLERAMDAGHKPANLKLARLLTSGPEEKRDYRRAAKLLTEASEAAHAPSQYALAQLYERGLGVEPDAAKAFEWYRQAAFNLYDASHKARAQYRLARMLDSGHGTARDPAKALALYRLAALSGHADALGALADYLYRGDLVDRDPAKARELYRAAAERGNVEAMSNLAALLVRGEGGVADPALAYSWLLVADKAGHPEAGKQARLLQASLDPQQRARVESTLLPVLSQ